MAIENRYYTTIIKQALFSCFFCVIATNCSRVVYVPVEKKIIEYRANMSVDSIYIKDSIFIHSKGDTVFLNKTNIVYRNILKIDSIYKCDTIQVAYPVEVIKYKKSSFKDKLFEYIIIFVACLIFFMIARKYVRFF